MTNDFEQKKRSAYSSRRSIMDIGMGILWITMGALFIFKDYVGLKIDFPEKPFDYIFGGICMIYGGFRIYRGVKKNYY